MNQAIQALEKGQRVTQAQPQKRTVVRLPVDVERSRKYYSVGLQYYSMGKLKEALVSWENAIRF